MNLILFEREEIGADGEVRMSGGRAKHVREVLGARPGEHIRVGVVNGPKGTACVERSDPGDVRIHCEFTEPAPEIPLLDLLLALPRPKVMRRLWAQLAAIGVGRIIITKAWKVERNYFDTHVLDPATYRPLLIEGLEQAQDTRLPEVSIHRQFKVLVEDKLDGHFPEGVRLMADPAAAGSVRAVLSSRRGQRVLLAVGPEGGWIDYEKELLGRHGFIPVSMGPRTLRTDTACIAMLALANEALRRST